MQIKHKIKKLLGQRQHIRAIIISLIFSSFVPFLFSENVYAGSPQLQEILDSINSDCKDMSRGSDTWKKCTSKEDTLAKWAECANGDNNKGLFEENSNGKWSPVKLRIGDCQKKINDKNKVSGKFQERLNNIENTCANVERTDGTIGQDTDWNKCERWQKDLEIIGCSGEMFEKIKDGGIGESDRYSYKQGEFNKCQRIINDIKTSNTTKPGEGIAPGDGSADAGQGTEETQCDGSSTPLSWIVCPVVEFGANFVNDFFENFLRPLLEDVPISLDSNNGSFKAWQGFRVIANILLVTAMMAIVYAQARGDK